LLVGRVWVWVWCVCVFEFEFGLDGCGYDIGIGLYGGGDDGEREDRNDEANGDDVENGWGWG